MEGWIKLYRQFTKWEWYKDIKTKAVFLHLLLLANHEENKWQGQTVKRGQVVIGTIKMAEELGISRQSVRTSLNRLKSTNEITIKSTNKYSLVTIVNYEKFQGDEIKSTNETTNNLTFNQPATNQQLTTNKNDKNIYIYFINKYKKEKPITFADYLKVNRQMKEDSQWDLLTREEQLKLVGR